MPSHTDDRLLWFVAGFGLVLAYLTIPTQLDRVHKLTEIKARPRYEDEDRPAKREASDALRISTLKTLAECPSYEQSSAAINLITIRTTKPATWSLLLKDLAGKDANSRENAVRALGFLTYSTKVSNQNIPQLLCTPEAINALISCLRNLLPLHNVPDNSPPSLSRYAPPHSPVLPPHRPVIELLALRLLDTILQRSLPIALRAGLVSRWLKHYPFPCAQPDQPGRLCDIVVIFHTWWQDDPAMAEILTHISRDPAGRRELRLVGLMASLGRAGSSARDRESDPEYYEPDLHGEIRGIEYDSDVSMVDGEDTAGIRPSTQTTYRLPRARTHISGDSAEEQALRRRRREAVVVSDGNAPLGRENIIEPLRDRFQDEQPARTGTDVASEQHNVNSSTDPTTAEPPAGDAQQSVWAGLHGLRSVMGEGELEVDSEEESTSEDE